MIVRKVSLRAVMEDDNMIAQWALDEVLGAVDATIAMQEEWGEPCPDYEPECPACAAWKAFRKVVR